MDIYFDTETYSATPIARGTDVYARDAECMVITWAANADPVKVIDLTNGDDPTEFFDTLEAADRIIAHNATFDRTILRHCFGVEYPLSMWHCTMAQAQAHALPASLGQLAQVLRVPDEFIKLDGSKLIHLFCSPNPKNWKLRRNTRQTHPEDWERFLAYARVDTECMRECFRRMPITNYFSEHKRSWEYSERHNDAGLYIDTELAREAIEALRLVKIEADQSTQLLTAGAVGSATQVDRLLAYLAEEHDISLPNLQSSTIEEALDSGDLPPEAVELLRQRRLSAKSSTSKYKRAVECTSPDDRLRYTMAWSGAERTGRDAGRILNPQNLPRPTLDRESAAAAAELVRDGLATVAADLYGLSVPDLCAETLRGLIIAPPEQKVVVADLANIEGRVLAWLAGEQWKLDAFAAYDRGEGPDLYKVAYGRAFDVDPATIAKDQRRFLGKVMELAMGYQGGVGAFVIMGATAGLDPADIVEPVMGAAPDWAREAAGAFWEWSSRQGRTHGLPEEQFIACDILKRLWRHSHPAIVEFWRSLEAGALAAVQEPGHVFGAGRIRMVYAGGALQLRLPGGRTLCYVHPYVAQARHEDVQDDGTVEEYTRPQLRFWGRKFKKWTRQSTYGGKLAENVTQATSQSIMRAAYPLLAREGFEVVLRVHDEFVAYAPIGRPELSAERMCELMTHPHPWLDGLPLSAEGWEGDRYGKDD